MINKNLLLRNIKEIFGQEFLFIPTEKSFFKVVIDIYSEFFAKNFLSPVAHAVIFELIEKKSMLQFSSGNSVNCLSKTSPSAFAIAKFISLEKPLE